MNLLDRIEYARYEGRLLEAEDTVRNLISMGFDDITISKISNSLSIQQIVKIREDMNYDKVEHNIEWFLDGNSFESVFPLFLYLYNRWIKYKLLS